MLAIHIQKPLLIQKIDSDKSFSQKPSTKKCYLTTSICDLQWKVVELSRKA
jgi:hypothetical protein